MPSLCVKFSGNNQGMKMMCHRPFRAAAYVNGVKRVIISEPQDDIHIGRHQAAWCEAIEMGSAVADAF